MNTCNPALIPRNHRVEEALAAAVERADYSVMEKLLGALSQPFRDPPEEAGYHLPPPPSAQPYRTFAGREPGHAYRSPRTAPPSPALSSPI
jgi:uncharacterized protein YdiU (UPF0061 family)